MVKPNNTATNNRYSHMPASQTLKAGIAVTLYNAALCVIVNIEKISYYFDEAIKLSKADPGFPADRKFYELWENIHQPRPFVCDNNEITLVDTTFKVVEEASPRKGCFVWDETEACVSLIIEGREWLDKIQISIEDGDAVFSQMEPEFLEEMGLTYGERLEVIFE